MQERFKEYTRERIAGLPPSHRVPAFLAAYDQAERRRDTGEIRLGGSTYARTHVRQAQARLRAAELALWEEIQRCGGTVALGPDTVAQTRQATIQGERFRWVTVTHFEFSYTAGDALQSITEFPCPAPVMTRPAGRSGRFHLRGRWSDRITALQPWGRVPCWNLRLSCWPCLRPSRLSVARSDTGPARRPRRPRYPITFVTRFNRRTMTSRAFQVCLRARTMHNDGSLRQIAEKLSCGVQRRDGRPISNWRTQARRIFRDHEAAEP